MFKICLSFILCFSVYAADDTKPDYTRGIEYGYDGDDKFDTLIKQHNLAREQIVAFEGEGIEEDDDRCLGQDPHQLIFSFMIELMGQVNEKVLISYVYDAACYIRSQLNQYEPSLIVGIGRSPFMIVDMIQEILTLENYKGPTQIRHMAFSGSPDISLTRRDDYDVRGNVMVPRRIATIFSYFDELGFDKADQGIWFVDAIGYGSGKNALFRLLKEYYKLKGAKQPPIHFFMLVNKIGSLMPENRTFDYKDNSHSLIYSDNHLSSGIRPMIVPTTSLYLPDWLINFIDGDRVAMRCAPVQQYRPFMMRSGSEKTRSQPAPMYFLFNEAIRNAVKYLRANDTVDRSSLALEMTQALVKAPFLNRLLYERLGQAKSSFLLLSDDQRRTLIVTLLKSVIPANLAASDAQRPEFDQQ
ncbi:MAG: hypothetical protein KF798_07200 [Candidatus Paracaedibacteraceae bacterium]|nr:hypothetical protein [Candidatus Paracaedibacteraceae bacterium]